MEFEELKAKVEEALKATNINDAYSVGMRNAFRYVIFLIDGKEPQYEHEFDKGIDEDTWEAIQNKAKNCRLN